MRAADLRLGGATLADVCVALAARCSVVGLRVPSRCADLTSFARGVLQAMHAQHAQHAGTGSTPANQEQGVCECGGGVALPVAVLARIGRSALLLFLPLRWGQCGSRAAREALLRALRATLQQHGQGQAQLLCL